MSGRRTHEASRQEAGPDARAASSRPNSEIPSTTLACIESSFLIPCHARRGRRSAKSCTIPRAIEMAAYPQFQAFFQVSKLVLKTLADSVKIDVILLLFLFKVEIVGPQMAGRTRKTCSSSSLQRRDGQRQRAVGRWSELAAALQHSPSGRGLTASGWPRGRVGGPRASARAAGLSGRQAAMRQRRTIVGNCCSGRVFSCVCLVLQLCGHALAAPSRLLGFVAA